MRIASWTSACLVASVLTLCGCGSSRDSTTDLEATEEKVTALEKRIEALTNRLSAQGRGAYRNGPTLQIDKQGRQTILEALHEVRQELAAARQLLQERLNHIRNQQEQLRKAQEDNKSLNRQIILLRSYEKRTKIAQDELRHQQSLFDTIEKQLQASEHQRLEMEKAFAEFAADFLQLRALDTKKFDALQKRLREQIQRFMPSDSDKKTGDKT